MQLVGFQKPTSYNKNNKNIRMCRKSVHLLSAGKTKESYCSAVNMAAVRFKMSEPAH